jgi:NDP-sugar pyrophosphorylase family protein
MSMTLVVMAAGRGSRFGGMKQVAKVGPSGEALVDYAVYDAVRAGFDDVVFVVSEASCDAVEAHVEGGCGRHVPVRYALQKTEGRDKPWGTGHAVLSAADEVDGSFGVVNADDYYGQESFELLGRELAADHADHVLVAFRLRESLSPNGTVSRGVCRVEDGFLRSIAELHEVAASENGSIANREGVDLTGDELISTNLWGFRPSFWDVLAGEFEAFALDHANDPKGEFLIGDAVSSLADHGDERVRVVPTSGRFLGVTYADDVAGVRAEIADLVAAGRYPSRLWR